MKDRSIEIRAQFGELIADLKRFAADNPYRPQLTEALEFVELGEDLVIGAMRTGGE